jgi:Ricin-type beta-trefoil lectin domain
MAWLGRKRLTFIPLSRTDAQLPDILPPDWIDQIWQGVFLEPGKDLETGRPKPGADRSGRAYIQCFAILVVILIATTLPASADACVSPSDTFPSAPGNVSCPVTGFGGDNLIPLVNAGSDKCFSPTPQDGHFELAGLPIQQHTCDPSFGSPPVQSYQFRPLPDLVPFNDQGWFPCWGCIPRGAVGFFILHEFVTTNGTNTVATNLCMDARDGAKADWSVVQQWTCKDQNARSMVWYTEPGDFPRALKVRNFNSDLCLDVREGSSGEFAQLQQFHCTSNNPAQNFWQIQPAVFNLNGNWTDGSTRSAHIYQGPDCSSDCVSIMIDMSDFGRPNAKGSVLNGFAITVTFPDDNTYIGRVMPPSTNTPNAIGWSNGTTWTKKP